MQPSPYRRKAADALIACAAAAAETKGVPLRDFLGTPECGELFRQVIAALERAAPSLGQGSDNEVTPDSDPWTGAHAPPALRPERVTVPADLRPTAPPPAQWPHRNTPRSFPPPPPPGTTLPKGVKKR